MPTAAAFCGVLHAAVQTVWVLTGTTVPFSPNATYSTPAHLALTALALVAAAAAPATLRRPDRPARTVVTCALALTIPVFALGMLSLPAHVVTLAAGVGVDSATGLAHVLLSTALTGTLVLVALAHRRRLTGACPRCGCRHTGGHDAPLVHPTASAASRRTRRLAYGLMCGLLPWAGVKTVWTLGGDALGVTAEKWKEASAGSSPVVRALAEVGVDVTVLAAAAGFFLLAGLLYRWGQVFPRWVPFLAGRRVPRPLPLAPAWLTAVGLAVYGIFLLVYALLVALGALPAPDPDPELGGTRSGTLWMIAFGGSAFGGLGLALLAAARSYSARSRPICATAVPGEAADRVVPRSREAR